MSRDNVNGTLKLLKNNISNGILPLTDTALQLRKQKHPDSREPPLKVLVEGPIRRIHPVVYDDIDESLILKAATLMKGGSGPSGFDADELRRILTSREFGTSSTDLRKTFAQRIKRLCIGLETTTSLDAFTACRLILLDKKTWIATNRCGRSFKKNTRESNYDDFQERHCRHSGASATQCRSGSRSRSSHTRNTTVSYIRSDD